MDKCVNSFEKVLPACWQDDKRMDVFFSGFRPRELNPENYDSMMSFWQDLIEVYCTHKGEPFFNIHELSERFERKQVRPKCLDVVVKDLLDNSKLRLRTEYQNDPLDTWAIWAVNCIIKRPLSWSLSKLKSAIGITEVSNLEELQYVHLIIIKKFCEILRTAVLEPQRGKLLNYKEFKCIAYASLTQLTETGLKLCLHTLHCGHEIGMHTLFKNTDDETLIIKIPLVNKKDARVDELDHLRVLWKIEDTKLQEYTKQIQQQTNQISNHLKNNNREAAKVHLRKKKLIELKFEKRSDVLENIETLITRIEETQNNRTILDAYKIGSKALKDNMDTTGLDIFFVQEVMTDLRDVLYDHSEIEKSIANVNPEISTDDLERELNELIIDNANTNEEPKLKKKFEVAIDDPELLTMLEQLEVADNSLTSTATANDIKPKQANC